MGHREKVLEVARQQLGVCEPSGDDKYIRWYNSVAHTSFNTNTPWCGIFVSWVLRMAEVPEDACPNFASCGVIIEWAKKNNIWKPAGSGYLPSPADLIIFDWKNDGKQDHVGFVEDHDEVELTTIEGNTSDRVGRQRYPLIDLEIMGYVALKLDKAPAKKPAPKKLVRNVQKVLNDKFKASLALDNVWDNKDKQALVKAVQSELNALYRSWLTTDGIWGPKTKKAWREIGNGNTSNLVLLAQIALIAHGYDIAADGIFGDKTEAATRDFQGKNALKVDGIIGPITMTKLVK